MTIQDALRPGVQLGRYTVERVQDLPEIDARITFLRHDLGARHMHVHRADDNLAFGVVFPTVPQDSTGVAHILEHVALMGSANYPVPDPFFAMLPRSLNTFMNAFTSSDWTAYPFSTRNTQDYFNLLSVYLDAAFFPLLRYESFRQDGHRLEFETPGDAKSALKLGGVVYNEMKGAMAAPASIMYRAIGKALYPDLTYANNSGGEPNDIPSLTWEDLRAFHARHYHPSNAFFYTYGSLPLEQSLQVIEERVMSKFTPQALDVSIPDQTPFAEPRALALSYPGTDLEGGAQGTVAWKLGRSFDASENLKWSVLSELLLGNPAAPLYHALIESGVGSSLADASGYHDNFREGAFTVGLKGVSAARVNEVEALVLNALQTIARDGIPAELVDSALHQFEIAQKEVSNAGWPYGLKLMMRGLGPWLHGGDPISALNIDVELARLQAARAEHPRLFEEVIEAELLRNPHRATITLTPDADLAARTEAEERALVERLTATFTDEDRQRVLDENAALDAMREADVDHGVLPTLSTADIPTGVPRPAYTTEETPGAIIGRVPQPTSGLVYLDVQVRVNHLPGDLLDLLPLYAFALTRSGAAGLTDVQMTRRVEAVTGGVSASVGSGVAPSELQDLRAAFTLSGKALSRNADALVSVLHDYLTAPQFTPERVRQLLRQRVTALRASVVSSGTDYALRTATAQLTPEGALDERQGGITHLRTLEAAQTDEAIAALLDQFARLQRALLDGRARVCLTAQDADLNLDLTAVTQAFQGTAPDAPVSAALSPRTPVAYTVDTPVAYNVRAYPGVPYTHADNAALLVLSRLLRTTYLQKELRERGGAYGGYATFDPRGGVFGLASYRDPHIARTYGVFDRAQSALASLTDRDLTEAILSASKQLDPLTSPDTVGRLRFYGDLGGYTADVQEAYKARLLAVTQDDLRRVASTYLRADAAANATVAGRNPNAETADAGLTFDVRTL
ncbi:insulinase family protein [Deinococcus maricopensis]|uniref:Peptidase M16C associated domain protein n=1 Tax=Deinococcus maricopensis (strain DSM 21211 / LMG 22137 / NRRL B-23946 / LB-34) TaxID=709986 RepID=E8U8F5_DEIML|nr:insulinase family protein [Deinococcus maricopensis]ADV67344.1 Peptidase M16C associated domain protein [Deinococcus maricopensis DSM 21211]